MCKAKAKAKAIDDTVINLHIKRAQASSRLLPLVVSPRLEVPEVCEAPFSLLLLLSLLRFGFEFASSPRRLLVLLVYAAAVVVVLGESDFVRRLVEHRCRPLQSRSVLGPVHQQAHS